MSSTSIGTGTPQDRNENTPSDSDPSRTLGAESGPPGMDAPVKSTPGLTGPTEGIQSDAGAPDVPAEVVEKAPSLTGPDTDPKRISQAFPEGPNVAPSPWEDEAARGRG